ncbi:hypothetical protein CBM2637_A70026 [Cupriavidus taiwanensis]|nr:hypothetical protein CBM2637_A70026 [Cupriavidus taiwanensis]
MRRSLRSGGRILRSLSEGVLRGANGFFQRDSFGQRPPSPTLSRKREREHTDRWAEAF